MGRDYEHAEPERRGTSRLYFSQHHPSPLPGCRTAAGIGKASFLQLLWEENKQEMSQTQGKAEYCLHAEQLERQELPEKYRRTALFPFAHHKNKTMDPWRGTSPLKSRGFLGSTSYDRETWG